MAFKHWFKKNKNELPMLVDTEKSKTINSFTFPSVPDMLTHPENMTPDQKKKSFTWQHYSQGNFEGMFGNEFGVKYSIQLLKRAYSNDDLIQTSIETIAKQFLGCSFQVVQQNKEEIIRNHPILRILHNPVKEDCGTFHFENIVEMYITGTNYAIWIPDEQGFRRLPTEAVTPELNKTTGDVEYYKVYTSEENGAFVESQVDPKDIWVSKLPNIFSRHVGMSAILSASLPALANKYSLEFILGFFLRGGNMAGIVELDKTDTSQISRLMMTIQQIMGTRRNMHSDKYLPKGAKWIAGGQKFSDVQIIDVIRQARRLFNARLGIPPALVGDTDGVNYANAESQIKLFWENAIIPLQKLYCRSIENSLLGKQFLREGEYLEFDNHGVKYIDPFSDRLNEDAKLRETLTINERRKRLGFDLIDDERADQLNFQEAQVEVKELEKNTTTRQNHLKRKKLLEMKTKTLSKMSNLLEPTEELSTIFENEFKRWMNIYNANYESKSESMRLIHDGKERFIKKLSPKLLEITKQTYFLHMDSTTIKRKHLTKSSIPNLKEMMEAMWIRQEAFMGDYIERQVSNSFEGYSDTATGDFYEFVERKITENPDMNIVSLSSMVRERFGEAYKSQANTIVTTELGSAVSVGSSMYAKDLSAIGKTARKQWFARNTDSPRHGTGKGLHEAWVNWDSSQDTGTLEDKKFVNGLRHPRDVLGSAAEAINCQCTIFFELGELR